mmetsp:Transcript_93955/g.140795  ORF Transcript_93955/g.140795 Transcript_93955/m.140795 type:complete len:193 (+) Transcript_93955:73-651(+)
MSSTKILLFSTLIALCDAFLSQNRNLASTAIQRPSSTKPLQLFEEASDFASTVANNLLLATIDSDIANIPDNEFGTIFAGGLTVMAGGVVSALIVGAILENGDLYANLAAESYLQGADDEEFWKGLSEEEKKKTQEVLAKIKATKEGGNVVSVPEPVAVAAEPTPVVASVVESPTEDQAETAAKQPDMFSDY